MTRVDRYNDEFSDNNGKLHEEVPLSRVSRHQNMYDELYMNTKLVDINNILPDEDNVVTNDDKKQDEVTYEPEVYEEKSYSVNDYLEKAHERTDPDNAKRDINSIEFKEQEDEIRKLIDSINEKEESEDFFKDLKGDDDNTTVGAKYKTDEFNDSIYETLKEENVVDENSILGHALSDKTVMDMKKDEEDKIDRTFEKIMIEDDEIAKKKNALPIVIFCILLFTLLLVIGIIILFK